MALYGRDSGAQIQTSQVWDVAEIYQTEGLSQGAKELLVRMYQNLNIMAMAVNNKDTGIYHTDEFVTGGTLYPNPAYDSTTAISPSRRQIYRKVIEFGALPDTDTKIVAHGITVTPNLSYISITGVTKDPVTNISLPLPFAHDTAVQEIALWIDGADIKVRTGNNRTAYTETKIFLEYIKQ